MSTKELYEKLTDYFGKIIIIPQMPNEIIGHADGYVRYVGEGRVVVNKWTYKDFDGEHNVDEYRTFITILMNAGFEVIEMPNKFDLDNPYSDYGDYLNYLVIDKVVIMQRYNIFEDNMAKELLQSLFPSDYSFESVDCIEVCEKGGGPNCFSWTIIK
jgi:agmatine/peptidylarginine deiminase